MNQLGSSPDRHVVFTSFGLPAEGMMRTAPSIPDAPVSRAPTTPSRAEGHIPHKQPPQPMTEMPQRCLSAYMFFANEQRDKVREGNLAIRFGMPFVHARSIAA